MVVSVFTNAVAERKCKEVDIKRNTPELLSSARHFHLGPCCTQIVHGDVRLWITPVKFQYVHIHIYSCFESGHFVRTN
jgi:hypothetical protein